MSVPHFLANMRSDDDLGPHSKAVDTSMQVTLTPDQEALVVQGMRSGRFGSVEDAVTYALSLWEERERERETLIASLDEAEASLTRDDGLEITPETMRELARDVKDRGRLRRKQTSTTRL